MITKKDSSKYQSNKHLLAGDHVHHGILEQRGKHEHETRRHPHINSLDVGHLR